MIRYERVVLMYTRACPAACAHCITESSPRARGKMSVAQAAAYLGVIPPYSGRVSFTGGEPLLFHREIVGLTARARSLGLSVVVVTGAGWVQSFETARRRVRELAQAGLTTMTVSWDAYHEGFSPKDRAVGLVRLGVEAGLDVVVRIAADGAGEWAGHRADFDGLPVRFERVSVIPLGRAATTLPPERFERTQDPPTGPCDVVLRPLIDPDGTVYACAGPSLWSRRPSPLVLGNAEAEPLAEILARALRDQALEVISLVGPYGLYRLLQDHPAGREGFRARPAYAGICELCLDITDSPELVAAVRERLRAPDGQALLAAARMWRERNTIGGGG